MEKPPQVRKAKIAVKENGKLGKGIIAVEDIRRNEILFDWAGGKVYEAESALKLPTKEISDHAIQFEKHKWIDTNGIGRYFNHSCEPNCGIKGRFQIIAMRDIKKGEWVTWDYEMTENSDWRMECKCGSKHCRKIIGAYDNMPLGVRKKYKGYISKWLTKKLP